MRQIQIRPKFKRGWIVSVFLFAVFLTGALIVFVRPLSSDILLRTLSVKVTSVPVNFSLANKTQTTFGKLAWRGGIELIGPGEFFGGLSGIAIGSDGTDFIAISDSGRWVTGNIQYSQDKLNSVSNIKISPLLDPRGRPYEDKSKFDAESVAPFGTRGLDGDLLIAFERNQRIGRYNFGKKGAAAREKTIKLPTEANKARRNRELESVGRFAKGRLAGSIIAISERFLDSNGNIIGWLIGGPTPGRFTVKRRDNFDITDLTVTPDNELIILERYFSTMSGVEMRLRRINVADIKPGAVLDGEVLLQTDQRNTIDNMEGLASHRAANGEVRLTLISDDNFNVFQRTLLLQFALKK
jgi:hypothetical protein